LALGIALIAGAFALARDNDHWANPLYWSGQLLLVLAPGWLFLRRRLSPSDTLVAAVLTSASTFIVVQCYGPVQFRFLDEFIHFQTATTILTTHHLFGLNTVLPVSEQYPGLEIVTTALVLLSHLSIYAAGTIVIGSAHVLIAFGICLLALEVTKRPMVAGLATLIYCTGPEFPFFDSYFLYEVLALALLIAALLATVRMLNASRRSTATAWASVTVGLGLATIITHHATSFALIAILFCLQIGHLATPRKSRTFSWHLPAVLGAITLLALAWNLAVAKGTLPYLEGYFRPVLRQLPVLKQLTKTTPTLTPTPTPTPALPPPSLVTAGTNTPTPPAFDRYFEYAADLALLLLTLIGLHRAWQRRNGPRGRLFLSFAFGASTIVLLFLVRVIAPDGSELASRLSDYVWIPLAVVAAVSLRALRSSSSSAAHRAIFRPALVDFLLLLLLGVIGIGGITGGWPAYYARFPGPFRAEAWERSVDQHNLLLSSWALSQLPPDYGVASDWTTTSMLADLGRQAPSPGIADLFLTPRVTQAELLAIRARGYTYIVVDDRLAHDLPAVGYYFENDPLAGHYTRPLPIAGLTKFNSIPGVSRIFDDGTLQVYDLQGSL
jgi:hypothetical protein